MVYHSTGFAAYTQATQFNNTLTASQQYVDGTSLPTGEGLSAEGQNYKTQIVPVLNTDEIRNGIPQENVKGFAIKELKSNATSHTIAVLIVVIPTQPESEPENVAIGELRYRNVSDEEQLATPTILGNAEYTLNQTKYDVTVYLAELPYGATVTSYKKTAGSTLAQVVHSTMAASTADTFTQTLTNSNLYLDGTALPRGEGLDTSASYKTQIVPWLVTDEIRTKVPHENVKGFAIKEFTSNQATATFNAAVLIVVIPSSPVSETGKVAIGELRYRDANNIEQSAIYHILGETSYTQGTLTPDATVYLAELPYGATVTSYIKTAGSTLAQVVHSTMAASTADTFTQTLTNSNLYLDGTSLPKGGCNTTYYNNNIVPVLNTDEIKNGIPQENVKGFAIKEFTSGTAPTASVLIVVIPTTDGSTINRTALDNQIAKVWNGETYTNNYYQETDRWNGINDYTKDENNPTRGFFWATTEKKDKDNQDDNPLKTALAAVSQAEVDAAYTVLSDAIANLIPTTEANTTLLYEAVKASENVTNGTSGSPLYTAASWNNFVEKRTAAANLMGQMFDSDGKAVATYNNPDNQTTIETTAAALVTAHGDLLSVNWTDNLNIWKMAETSLLNKANLEASKYETVSWGTWSEKITALSALQGKTITLRSDLTAWTTAIQEAAAAYAGLKDANSSITVHVRFADNYGAANPKYALANAAVATFDGDKTLSGNSRTLAGLLTALSYNGTQLNSGYNKYQPQLMAYINGELAVSMQSTPDRWYSVLINFVGSQTDLGQRQLHDGDRIVLVRTESPWVYRYTGQDSFSAPYRTIYPFAGLLSIQGEQVLEVEAGAPLTLEVDRTAGAPGANQRALPAADVNLIRSEAKDTQAVAAGTQALTDTGAKTGGDGKATATIYREGWYRLEAVNTTEQTNAKSADMVTITGGDYSNLFAGDYVLVHVVSSSNEAALRAQFRAELDEVFNVHGEDFYGARWAEVQSIYESACKVIDGKDARKPLLGDASDAKDSAIAQIEGIAAEIEAATNNVLEAFRRVSNMLPDDASLMTKLQIQAFTRLKTIYEAMSVYQRNLLTSAQLKKYNALLTAFGEDGSALPEAKWYTLHVVIDNEADRNKYDFAMETSYVLRTVENKSERINDYGKSSYGNGANQDFLFAPGSQGMTLYLFPDGYGGAGNPAVYVSGVTVEGADYTLNERDIDSALWYRQINPARAYLQSLSFRTDTENIYAPYSDITVHLTVRDSNDPKTTDELKAEAKAELTRAYQNEYPKSHYNAAQWAELTSAYNAGLAAIDAAEENGIEAAKAAAIAAMGAVETIDKADHSDSTVGSLGSVRVIVENTTYTGAPATMQGRFVERDMPLEADTTMMNAVLDALAAEGYSWIGTGPGSSTGREITYLATIADSDGATLSEFDGEPSSGWMGVLNDWFVNESFASFTTTATARDYRIVDGDEIRVMFTLKGYGTDLGGSWGDPNTNLKDLTYKGGTLTPAFDPTVKEYLLMTSGGSVSVTPTAANKNYQVKTFLNEKNTARDVEYYRRGEPIPVQTGDVIWIGCGEKNWLSMNNQGAEATGYSGTWYSITVVDSNSSAAVEQAIEKIGSVTYSNYESKEAAVKAARAAYDNLSAAAKGQVANSAKLETAEQKIEDYKEIDNVKGLLADLPKDATDAQVLAAADKIRAAEAAYLALKPWQQDYITVGDAEKYNALVTKWKELTPEGEQGSIPQLIAGGSGGEKKDKKDEGAEIAAATVTVTPEVVNGAAQAEVKAEDVSKALEEAPDAKTLTVKVNTEGAASVEADLPADAVRAAADAGVGLNVETEQGTVKLSAADVKAAGGKDLAVSVKSNADGTTSFEVSAGGTAVAANVKVELPAKDGQVLVIVNADGTEEVVKKCVTSDGKVYAEIPAGARVKVADAQGMSFGDVKATDWFAGAVEFVTSRGIFQGTGDGFQPNAPMNRAMLVTVLQRIAGEKARGENTFGDVEPDAWYADAVIWASENGIVNGTDNGFEPDEPVTREQIATMLYRFMKYLGFDVSASKALSGFPDGGDASPWAKEAMEWAAGVGLFQGDQNGKLNPGGKATRAEVATLVERLIGLMVK